MSTVTPGRLLKLAALVVPALITGCATTVGLSESDRAGLKNSGAPTYTLLYSSLGSNGLMVTTQKTAFAGPGAGFLAIKNGKEWTEQHRLAHPLIPVRDRLVSKLKSDFGLYGIKHIDKDIDVSNDTPEKLRAQLGMDKGTVLDLTGAYQVIYYAANWTHFHMYYNARARLVRLDDGKVLWQGNCRTDVEDPDNKPTYDDLAANDAARLKQWLNRGAAECNTQLLTQLAGKA
jgi:hypothetical protein